MISELTVETLDRIIPIGEAFAAEANYPGGFNWTAFSSTWHQMLEFKLGRIFVVEEAGKVVAALGMATSFDPYSGDLTALEQFWFVLASHRKTRVGLDLFERFEQAGKEVGAKKLVMVHLAALTPKSLQSFYEHQGYRLAEQTFWKEI